MNGEDYTNDGKTYGYFDPYVLNAEPRLISVEGTTKVRIMGFGFVNSSQTKSMISSGSNNYNLICNGGSCIKDATYIDKSTLET
jgi:dTDP-4-dehydrorhamnose 3,5-epimerase-like enzyme